MGIEFHLAANILGIFCFIFSRRIDLPPFSSLGCCHANRAISPPLTAQTEIRLENRVPLTSCCDISRLISPSLPPQSPLAGAAHLGWRGTDKAIPGEWGWELPACTWDWSLGASLGCAALFKQLFLVPSRSWRGEGRRKI